ncbi:restriction endonuclease [Cryobacterium sp. Hh11]|nr:restriction endonuclease [Cryobacterium sp. Hh11]
MPKFPLFRAATLRVLSDGQTWARRQLEEAALDEMQLSEEIRGERFKSGGQRANNRVGWSISMLQRAGAVERPERAQFQITEFGRELLARHPEEITDATLRAIPAFQDYVVRRNGKKSGNAVPEVITDAPVADEDPIELIEAGIAAFESEAASELIRKLREKHPDFFEQAVVDVLNKMGYGGTEERGRRLGGSGDGGVDGVIDQDALGLNRIYVQAKRYGEGNSVQRPEIQGFVGALAGKGAAQGVFVTTGLFSKGAREYVMQIPSRVVLIDGPRLAELMIRYRVGVQIKRTYEVVEVDEDYFE